VISDVLIAAMTVHHRMTIPNTLRINEPTIHKAPHQILVSKPVTLVSFDTAHLITNEKSQIFTLLSSHSLTTWTSHCHTLEFVNPVPTTYINNNQKLNANIV
jgi:hypothetical protein